MPAGSTRREHFVADELVVAIPHQDLVLGELADLADPAELVTNVRISRSDRRLGLSVITVTHAPGRRGRDGDDTAALDSLLARIRGACARRYDGWVPTIGKNRLLEQVIAPAGRPGAGSPVPCDGASLPPAPAGGRGRGVRVAVLDAHAFPHPDLVGRLEAEAEDTETYLRQTDKLPSHAGHATFVAGLIAQRAPLAGLDMHDVVDDDRPVTAWEIATAMARLAGSGVDVLTVSLGCHTADGAPPLLLERAVAALTPGVVVVAPAGNHGSAADGRVTPTTPFWPAALDAVVAVGAHDPGGTRAAFSPDVPWVNLSAPGVDVQSTYLFGNILVTDDNSDSTSLRPFDGYATWSSTTFATAAVCGEIAAGTVPGERAPREALNDLLRQLPSEAGVDIWAYDQRAGQ